MKNNIFRIVWNYEENGNIRNKDLGEFTEQQMKDEFGFDDNIIERAKKTGYAESHNHMLDRYEITKIQEIIK